MVRIDDDDIGRMPNRLNVDYCSPNEGMGETGLFIGHAVSINASYVGVAAPSIELSMPST